MHLIERLAQGFGHLVGGLQAALLEMVEDVLGEAVALGHGLGQAVAILPLANLALPLQLIEGHLDLILGLLQGARDFLGGFEASGGFEMVEDGASELAQAIDLWGQTVAVVPFADVALSFELLEGRLDLILRLVDTGCDLGWGVQAGILGEVIANGLVDRVVALVLAVRFRCGCVVLTRRGLIAPHQFADALAVKIRDIHHPRGIYCQAFWSMKTCRFPPAIGVLYDSAAGDREHLPVRSDLVNATIIRDIDRPGGI